MEDKEKIQNFGDMVAATERLTSPWRKALALTNILWAVVFGIFIALAYLTPETSYQYQDVQNQIMQQSVGTEVVAPGE